LSSPLCLPELHRLVVDQGGHAPGGQPVATPKHVTPQKVDMEMAKWGGDHKSDT